MGAHAVEKIKTVGEAYITASGLPRPRDNHADTAIRVALELVQVVQKISASHKSALELRVRVNSGPVVGGVVGRLRFIYDVFGAIR